MPNRVLPACYIIAQTALTDIESYLISTGSPDWRPDDQVSDSENLIEFAGRICYRSWEPHNEAKPDATNPNVVRVRKGNEQYIGHILEVSHGSVCEHASITFVAKDVSRIFTHEQVRHRAGFAYSQESLRFVRLTSLKYYLPNCIAEDEWAAKYFHSKFEEMEKWQQELADHFEKDLSPNAPFSRKKELTSAFRRLAPEGLATSIVVTANLRALRHVIRMRTSPGAEEEIRVFYDEVARMVKEAFPNVFQDMERLEDGEWAMKYGSI
jgi:thymidylate synthase (FAD)